MGTRICCGGMPECLNEMKGFFASLGQPGHSENPKNDWLSLIRTIGSR